MGKQWKQWQTLFSWAPITADSDCSHKIKRHLLLGRKAMTKLDSELKTQRHHFANKGPHSQSYSFSSSHVQMWEFNHKIGWAPKNWCFWIVVWERTLESPLDCKEIKPINCKGNQSEYLSAGLMLKLKLQYFDHWMQRADSLEKTLMLGKTEVRWRGGKQRMRWSDDITDSMNRKLS